MFDATDQRRPAVEARVVRTDGVAVASVNARRASRSKTLATERIDGVHLHVQAVAEDCRSFPGERTSPNGPADDDVARPFGKRFGFAAPETVTTKPSRCLSTGVLHVLRERARTEGGRTEGGCLACEPKRVADPEQDASHSWRETCRCFRSGIFAAVRGLTSMDW